MNCNNLFIHSFVNETTTINVDNNHNLISLNTSSIPVSLNFFKIIHINNYN